MASSSTSSSPSSSNSTKKRRNNETSKRSLGSKTSDRKKKNSASNGSAAFFDLDPIVLAELYARIDRNNADSLPKPTRSISIDTVRIKVTDILLTSQSDSG